MKLPRLRASIRTRVALAAFLSLTAVLLVSGILIDSLNERDAMQLIDRRITAEAEALAVLTKFDGTRIELDFEDETMPAYATPGTGAYFQVSTDTKILECSRSLAGRRLPLAASKPEDGLTPEHSRITSLETVAGPFEPRVRMVTLRTLRWQDRGQDDSRLFDPTIPHAPVTVQVARALDEVVAVRQRERRTLWIALPLALVLGVLTVFVVARRATLPLRRFTAEAQEIAAGRSQSRLDAASVEGELRELGLMINRAFDHLEAAAARDRRFAGDAAHELRTPLAVCRSRLELALSRERSSEEYRDAVRISLGALAKLQSIVESLLLLARCDGGELPMAKVDLRAVALQACEAGREHHSGTVIRSTVPDRSVLIDADEKLLVRLLSVLIDNAAIHGASADGMELAIAEKPGGPVVVTISDRGPGFTDDLRARAGEYFARSDASRNRRFGGTGLGLVLASRIVAAHGATLDLGNRHGGGAEVRIVFRGGPVAGGGVVPAHHPLIVHDQHEAPRGDGPS